MPLKARPFSEGDTQPSDQSLNGRTTVERESQSFLKPLIKQTFRLAVSPRTLYQPNNLFKMKTLSLILCFAIAAAVAKPQYGDDCSDCVNHCKTVKKIKYVEEYEDECHIEHR